MWNWKRHLGALCSRVPRHMLPMVRARWHVVERRVAWRRGGVRRGGVWREGVRKGQRVWRAESPAKGWCCSGQYRRVLWVGSWVVGSGGSLFNACTSNAHTVLDCAIVHQPVSLYGSSLNSLANTSFVTHPTLPLHLLSPLLFDLSPFTSQLSSVPFHLSSPRIHTVPFSVAISHV